MNLWLLAREEFDTRELIHRPTPWRSLPLAVNAINEVPNKKSKETMNTIATKILTALLSTALVLSACSREEKKSSPLSETKAFASKHSTEANAEKSAETQAPRGTSGFAKPIMAKGYKRWVQPDAELANPYMGTKMLSCGTAVHELSASSGDETASEEPGDDDDHSGHSH